MSNEEGMGQTGPMVGSLIQHTLTQAQADEVNKSNAHHGLSHLIVEAEQVVAGIVVAIENGIAHIRLFFKGNPVPHEVEHPLPVSDRSKPTA